MPQDKIPLLLVSFVPILVVSIFALVAAATDFWRYRIYNLLTFPLMGAGLLYHTLVGFYLGTPGESFLSSFLGLLFGLGILIAPFMMGGMGGGDVKLMGAVGAWLGVVLTFYVFIVSALAAGVCAVIMVVISRNFRETWVNFQVIVYRVAALGQFLGSEDSLESRVSPKDRKFRLIPFGVMLFLGLIVISVGLWFGALPSVLKTQ